MGTFETIQRRLIAKNSKFEVFFDEIDDGQGEHVQDYLVVVPRHRAADLLSGVVILPVFEDKIGLVRVYRHAIGAHGWELPRGFIDEGEDAGSAALRELQEEAGLSCRPANLSLLGHVFPEAGMISARVALFVARECTSLPTAKLRELGHTELRFFSPAEVGELIAQGEMQEACSLVAYYRYLSF